MCYLTSWYIIIIIICIFYIGHDKIFSCLFAGFFLFSPQGAVDGFCSPPRGQWMDYNYADNSFAALGSSNPREIRLEL